MNIKTALVGIALTFTSLCARAEIGGDNAKSTSSRSEVNGSVVHTDNRKPLRDVTVTAYSAAKKEMSVVTDGSGNYNFNGLRSGTYRFVFERQGYRKVVKEKVVVRTDEGLQLNVGMEEEEFGWIGGSLQFLIAE